MQHKAGLCWLSVGCEPFLASQKTENERTCQIKTEFVVFRGFKAFLASPETARTQSERARGNSTESTRMATLDRALVLLSVWSIVRASRGPRGISI